jgi:hypothetical protein
MTQKIPEALTADLRDVAIIMAHDERVISSALELTVIASGFRVTVLFRDRFARHGADDVSRLARVLEGGQERPSVQFWCVTINRHVDNFVPPHHQISVRVSFFNDGTANLGKHDFRLTQFFGPAGEFFDFGA